MPDFGHPFSGLKNDRMVTHAELVRAIRFMVAAEYEAIQLYMQLAESTDNTLAQQVLVDIANEERVHAGEFLRLLKELDPEEEIFYQQGAAEVEEEFLGGATDEPQAVAGKAPTGSATAIGLNIGSLKR
ncbi:Rubrerythrin [Geoalkalibacter ferrihydriticus]|uniref:Rubrerythrin n=2 Tax=Geoalkalibacter ferrihydriticus TaxID=392333 RepID=A0A0C2EAM3_9BACT|nr:ferritin family protein [Geoalkalibacter ferrihydriticus]KIH75613.1 rubrerythrin [Geoalkalibacter ferrihydriticus DSM 17813]SDL29038.1 Rubrerythrin [Geoalkalibacter ferrihydriticus]